MPMPAADSPMSDARQLLRKVIDFCSAGWLEADQAPDQTDDAKDGQKRAYNAVYHFAQDLLDGEASP